MTRYARAKGSKACNSRQAGSATPWQLFKEQIVSSKSDTEDVNKIVNSSQDDKMTETHSEGSWYNFQADSKSKEKDSCMLSVKFSSQPKKKSNKSVPKASPTEGTSVKSKMEKNDIRDVLRSIKTEFNKRSTYNKSDNRLSQTKRKVQVCFTSSGMFRVTDNVTSNKESVQEEVSFSNKYRNDLRDSRRNAKAFKREKKIVCFCCRRWGHQLADCPEAQKGNKMEVIVTPGSFCYNCGSTEHSMSKCSKPGKKTFKYAHCFVCGEEGHLARLCPDNPKGNYPKGGSCLLCGEVTHLRADCPKARQESRESEATLTCATSGPIESLPEDLQTSPHPNKAKRIVQFR